MTVTDKRAHEVALALAQMFKKPSPQPKVAQARMKFNFLAARKPDNG